MLADLIPESFFIARETWLLWLLTAGGIVVLVAGADRAVNAAVRLAGELGMSKVIIGATVVSLGTTAPEAAVSVMAAFNNKPGLALGNGVGSIICNTALIFGLCCCIARLPKDRFILYRHGWLQLGSGALLVASIFVLAAMNGSFEGVVVPRTVGFIFVALLAGYLYLSVRWARKRPDVSVADLPNAPPKEHRATKAIVDLGMLVVGLVLVVGGSGVLVGSVSQICLRYGVPQSVLAVTVIAFGTSVPELATAIASIIKGHPELLIGNIIGANILNVLFVIGVSAMASPLGVPMEFFYIHLPVMMVSLLLFRFYIFLPRPGFRRWQGVVLLAVFGGYYTLLLAKYVL